MEKTTEAWRAVLDDLVDRGLTVAQRSHHQRHRAAARGVQATDQDATVLPSADTAAMLFWTLLASGQINMRKVNGRQTLATQPIDQPIDLAA